MGNRLEFAGWLTEQLNERNWSQADLSRRSGISQAHVSRFITGSRDIGPEAAIAIARALKLPEDYVFRKAGLLPPEEQEKSAPGLAEWIHAYLTASPEERESMLKVAKALSSGKKSPPKK